MLKAEVEVEVRFHDCDPMGVTWHGHYVGFLESARSELLNRIGYNFRQMTTSGYAWPVVELKVKYLKTTTFGQRLCVRAELEEYENRLRIGYTITDCASGEVVTKASTTQVAVDQARREMCFVSPQIFVDKVQAAIALERAAGGASAS